MHRDTDPPRERLSSRGPEILSDVELVALLLRTGSARRDAIAVARDLLARQGGLAGVAGASAAQLAVVPGVGPAKAASVLAAIELGRRLSGRRLQPGDPVRGPEDVYRHFHPRLRDRRQEHFLALLLDGRHRVQGEVLVSQGTLTASLVHPREVFRPALREAAAALILVHNHPSGDASPSAEDREVTARLVEAGDLLGVRVLDHVIVAERGYTSLRDGGSPDLFGQAPLQRGRVGTDESRETPGRSRHAREGAGSGGATRRCAMANASMTNRDGSERRRSERTPVVVKIEYATVDAFFSDFTRDINEGGLFVESENPLPRDSEVHLQFQLPGEDEPLRVSGRVMHVKEPGSDEIPGMGIQFEDLDEVARGRINDLVRMLRVGR